MAGTDYIDNIDAKFQDLFAAYLRRLSRPNRAEDRSHLDEDSLAAFAEGRLTRREALPVVSHLADCGFCRHTTADLVRLEIAFEGDTITAADNTAAEPAGLAETISSWFARLFGTTEAGVFAHSEPEPDDEAEDEAEDADGSPEEKPEK